MPDWTKDLYTLRYHWKWVGLLVGLGSFLVWLTFLIF